MSSPGKGGYIATLENVYKTTYGINDSVIIKNLQEFATKILSTAVFNYTTVTITAPSDEITTIKYSTDEQGTQIYKFKEIGTYLINYKGTNTWVDGLNETHFAPYSFTYYISVIENKLPLKKWTITSVINRLLDIAEPIRKGKKPRFRLQGMKADGTFEKGSQAELFDKTLAPEFSFTKQTLRECLQEVGKVIHGEPRLEPKKDENEYYYEVSYDMYASQEKSGIYHRKYAEKTVKQLVDSYTGWVDSNAENLINQLDKYGGVIIEPYRGGAKTVRTENLYVPKFFLFNKNYNILLK